MICNFCEIDDIQGYALILKLDCDTNYISLKLKPLRWKISRLRRNKSTLRQVVRADLIWTEVPYIIYMVFAASVFLHVRGTDFEQQTSRLCFGVALKTCLAIALNASFGDELANVHKNAKWDLLFWYDSWKVEFCESFFKKVLDKLRQKGYNIRVAARRRNTL